MTFWTIVGANMTAYFIIILFTAIVKIITKD
jgi:hypothetical protein